MVQRNHVDVTLPPADTDDIFGDMNILSERHWYRFRYQHG